VIGNKTFSYERKMTTKNMLEQESEGEVERKTQKCSTVLKIEDIRT
jgi:hypothetical protein